MTAPEFDVIVIGEGIAGLAAAGAAAESGARTASFEATLFGGLITNVNVLEPSPHPELTGGADLAATMVGDNADRGVRSFACAVEAIEASGSGFAVRTAEGVHHARCVVIATGARLRRLGIPGEDAFEGRGVSNCADCDGPLYRDRDVVVVGGGDSALQEAAVLAQFCRTVHLVHRGATVVGRADFAQRLAGHANVRMHANAELTSIEGDSGVARVRGRRLDGGDAFEIACEGVFAYVGLVPDDAVAPPQVRRDGSGRLLADANGETSVRGLFAAGAIRSGCGGTLADARDDGIRAGRTAAARRD